MRRTRAEPETGGGLWRATISLREKTATLDSLTRIGFFLASSHHRNDKMSLGKRDQGGLFCI